MRRGALGLRVGLALLVAIMASTGGGQIDQAQAAGAVATFGKTTVGASFAGYTANQKQVNRYALPAAGSVTKLSAYLAPAGTSGKQVLKGMLYADASGKPGALLGVSQELTFTSTSTAGWYDLGFSSPVKLAAGNYWIGVIPGATAKVAGFRFDKVNGSRAYNANTYTTGPSNPFGTPSTDAKQTSLYATYTPPPVNTAPPTITGTAQQGQTLSEHHGSWTNEPSSYVYQWLQCGNLGGGCLPIAGATSQSYTPSPADVGHTIKVQETASNAGGSSSPATSGATAIVVLPQPANTTPPAITGTAGKGQALSTSNGTWTNEPTSYAYQWQRCDAQGASCTAISGATTQTYTAGAADVGSTLRVAVTASNSGGSSPPASSAPTQAVQPAPPVNTSSPTISGAAQSAQSLTAGTGSWTESPTSYAYQWQQCDAQGASCTAISGATTQTYTAGAADVGSTLRVAVTASNSGGSSAPASSAQTEAVQPAPPVNTSSPTISGAAQSAQSLTAGTGSWTESPTSYAYQWQQCDAQGASCTAISGATTQTYTAGSADVGSTLRVAVTASNSGGSSAPASSAQTEVATCSPQSPYSGAVSSTPGLVAYWRLGESSGTLACDSTGHDNGTYLGGAALGTPGAIVGDPDTAVSLNGSSSQVSVPATNLLNVGDSFSIEGWVKRADSATGSNQVIVSKQEGSWVLMFNESGRLTLRRSTVADVATAAVVTTDTSSWHYVAATKAGSSVHLYLDGTDVTGSVSNQTIADNNQPLVIGQSTGTAYLNGSVDEVALYNTALSPARIAEHYSAGMNVPLPPSALTATPGNGTARLSWAASPSTTAAGYKVYRANADGSWPSTPLVTVSSSTLTYTDAGLINGSTYTYRVTSYDGAGKESGPSNQVSAAVGCASPQSPYSGAVSSTPGLVAYWRLGESSGTLACDSTGHDNGTYLGGAALGTPGAIVGDPDTAVSLNGSSSQVSVPATNLLNVGDSFSIEGWVKRADSATGSNQVIVSKQEGSWVLMFNESGRLTLRRSTVADVATAAVVTTDTSSWHYVAATKAGSSVHLYLDGTDVTGSVSNQTIADNNQPLVIGQSTGTAYLNGSVDEVALYNTALSPARIAEHYSAGMNPNHDPVLGAVGDIACAAGNTTDDCKQLATANLTSAQKPTAVAVLGDNQYESGLLSEYDSPGAYNDTWGQFNPIVHPTPGNHEYAASATASGYFTYFGSIAGSGYYSYDLGAWHIISLNSNCSDSGCQASLAGTTSSAEVSWLQGDLAVHQNQCVLAYWHHPRFSSGPVGSSPGVAPFWNALYAAHADVVLNGHDHLYERFAQQDPAQTLTSEGIREFVVGTGGEELEPAMGTIEPNMQVADIHHFGVLFLTLHPGSYDWAFRATDGTVLDSGSTPCHA